jgi:hypothetical protein
VLGNVSSKFKATAIPSLKVSTFSIHGPAWRKNQNGKNLVHETVIKSAAIQKLLAARLK